MKFHLSLYQKLTENSVFFHFLKDSFRLSLVMSGYRKLLPENTDKFTQQWCRNFCNTFKENLNYSLFVKMTPGPARYHDDIFTDGYVVNITRNDDIFSAPEPGDEGEFISWYYVVYHEMTPDRGAVVVGLKFSAKTNELSFGQCAFYENGIQHWKLKQPEFELFSLYYIQRDNYIKLEDFDIESKELKNYYSVKYRLPENSDGDSDDYSYYENFHWPEKSKLYFRTERASDLFLSKQGKTFLQNWIKKEKPYDGRYSSEFEL